MDDDYERNMAENSFLPFHVGYLTDWMVEKAEKELNEKEETRDRAISELRKLIASDKSLDVWTDDAHLLQFLRARKFNVKKAWDLLRTFYQVKRDFSEVFPVDFDFDQLRRLGETSGAGAYDYRNKDGSVVLFVQAEHWDPNEFHVKVIIAGLSAMYMGCVQDPATQVCGAHLILDSKGYTWEHFRQVTPRYIRLLSKGLRNAFPVRFKGIHVLHEPVVFTYIVNIFKMFLSEKMKNRIHFHGSNLESLHKHISKEILPPEYGGDNKRYNPREFCKKSLDLYIGVFKGLLEKGYH